METLHKIQYLTSKGQITLPVAWRKRVQTDAVMVRQTPRNTIEISAAAFKDDHETGWVTIFSANRDNNGVGLTADEILSVLRGPTPKRKSSGKK